MQSNGFVTNMPLSFAGTVTSHPFPVFPSDGPLCIGSVYLRTLVNYRLHVRESTRYFTFTWKVLKKGDKPCPRLSAALKTVLGVSTEESMGRNQQLRERAIAATAAVFAVLQTRNTKYKVA